jgi:hypothetical protein
MELCRGEFEQAANLMRTVSGIHELIVQYKICCLAFREAVTNDVGEEWGWVDGKNGTDSVMHLAIPNEFDL